MRYVIVVAAALFLPACNSPPAHTKTADEVDKIIDVASKSIGLAQRASDGAADSDIQAATQEMVAALLAASGPIRTITDHVNIGGRYTAGEIDPVSLSSCIISSTTEILDLEHMTQRVRQRWALDIARCATLASVYLDTVSDKQRIDDVGFALGIIYPTSLAAWLRAGYSAPALLQAYRSANEAIIAKLAPICREWRVQESAQAVLVHYQCKAHNDAMAEATETYVQGKLTTEPINRRWIDAEATRLTSRGVAMAVLAELEVFKQQVASAPSTSRGNIAVGSDRFRTIDRFGASTAL